MGSNPAEVKEFSLKQERFSTGCKCSWYIALIWTWFQNQGMKFVATTKKKKKKNVIQVA